MAQHPENSRDRLLGFSIDAESNNGVGSNASDTSKSDNIDLDLRSTEPNLLRNLGVATLPIPDNDKSTRSSPSPTNNALGGTDKDESAEGKSDKDNGGEGEVDDDDDDKQSSDDEMHDLVGEEDKA